MPCRRRSIRSRPAPVSTSRRSDTKPAHCSHPPRALSPHHRGIRLLASLTLLAAFSLPASAVGGVLVRAPVEDVGMPFWCDRGYDWDERCYIDNTARLPVGGVDDKVWRGTPTTGPSP